MLMKRPATPWGGAWRLWFRRPHRDGTARWVKHVDYARLKAVEDLLIVRPSKGKGDRGVWELTEKGKRRAERAAKALADRAAG